MDIEFIASTRTRAVETQHETGTCHAEALTVAWLRLHSGKFKKRTKFELLIYRERKDGSLGMAKPCKHCVELLKRAVDVYGFNICRITYSLPNGTYESTSVSELSNDYLTSGTRRMIALRGGSV